MRKHLQHLMTLAVAAGLLAGAGTASASTVTVTPGGAVTGTTGAVQFAFNTARKTLHCTSATYTSTYAAGTFTGVTLPFALSANVDLRFPPPCTVTGGAAVGFTCTRTARFDLTGATTGTDGVTPLAVTAISCPVSVTGGTCSVTISGTATGQHNNRNATLTVNATGQTLAATGSTNGSGGTCSLLPNDTSVTYSTSVGSSVTYAESPRQGITVT